MEKAMFRLLSETIYPIFRGIPRSYAHVLGSDKYPEIEGMVLFYPYENGTVIVADVGGLPTQTGNCTGNIFGFHIHEGEECTGNETDPFANTGMHYSKQPCDHPYHTGDMPVLFENQGKVWMAFYTDRFTPDEIRGKTVVIHDMPDDFRTNPSGDSGKKIACGQIR